MSYFSVTSRSRSPYSYYNYYANNFNNKGNTAHKAYIKRNQNTRNTGQYTNTIMQGAKCPHGFPGGGCPICMGKIGGGGGADSKKKTGMSWDEAYYVYTMIQKNKLLAADDKKLTEAAQKRLQLLEKIQSSELYQRFMAIKMKAVDLATQLQNTVIQIRQFIARNIVKPIIDTMNKVVTALKATVASLIGVVNKLTAQLGEKLKMTREAIRQNIRKLLASLRETEFISRLITVFNDKRQLYQELLLRKIEAFKEKLKKFTGIITFIAEKDPDEEEKQHRPGGKAKKFKRKIDNKC